MMIYLVPMSDSERKAIEQAASILGELSKLSNFLGLTIDQKLADQAEILWQLEKRFDKAERTVLGA